MIIPISLISFAAGVSLAWLVAKYGNRFDLLDVPNRRSSHVHPTPRGGGAGIPLAVLVSTLFFIKAMYILVIAAVSLAVFSLIDDRMNLPAPFRLLIESIFAVMVILSGRISLAPLTGHEHGLFITIPAILISALVITAAANFFNFMDGIDGLAGVTGMISFGLLAFFSKTTGNETVFLLALAVMASAAGFLIFNFPKAKVFMGDVGSIFLGFLFASLALAAAGSLSDLLVLLSFQGIFYFDCLSTLLIRLRSRENIFEAHLGHLYQRLVHQHGWSHPKVTLVYTLAQLFTGIIMLMLVHTNPFFLLSFLVILFFLFISVRIHLRP